MREAEHINSFFRERERLLLDKNYEMKNNNKNLVEALREIRKDYFKLKSERETVHVTARCDKCK